MRKFVLCVSAVLVLTCVSCKRNGIYPVLGKVTYNGSPASEAVVFFFRQGGHSSNDPAIMSIVQADGSFELVCGSLGKGAPPGQYDVLIEWKQTSQGSKGRPRHGPDILQGRYADPKHPLLHATVEAKTNNLPPFELADVKARSRKGDWFPGRC